MKLLRPEQHPDSFFSRLRASEKRLLMLDYDGTLAPFCDDRNQALPYTGVRRRLREIIASKKTRLIIVSGRWSMELIKLLGLDPIPEIWGCHGAERVYPDMTTELIEVSEVSFQGLAMAEKWAEKERLTEFIERKPTSLAFHWRGLEQNLAEELREKVPEGLREIAQKHGLELHDFDAGLELRVAHIDKGRAVTTVLEETGYEAVTAYLGDDFTDEDAFRALAGYGLRVLVRPELRPTEADIWIQPPDELLDFLDRWIESIT
jgi:trehalose-phosphatase